MIYGQRRYGKTTLQPGHMAGVDMATLQPGNMARVDRINLEPDHMARVDMATLPLLSAFSHLLLSASTLCCYLHNQYQATHTGLWGNKCVLVLFVSCIGDNW